MLVSCCVEYYIFLRFQYIDLIFFFQMNNNGVLMNLIHVKMPKIPPLKSLQAFEAAARLGSFQKAADELFLTPSAISHQVKFLEEYLGVELFSRLHRGVSLTDLGLKYATSITRAMSIIEKGTAELKEPISNEILTIQSTPTIAAQWLRHKISHFSSHYGIDVRLNASMDVVDLVSGQADIAICYQHSPLLVSPAGQGLVVEPFPKEKYVVICSPSLIPKGSHFDIREHMLVHSEMNLYKWQQWSFDHHNILSDDQLKRGHRFDRTFMSINAIVDGDGVGLESALMIEKERRARKIIFPLLPHDGPSINCHFLVYAEKKKSDNKIKQFRDWIMTELEISCKRFPK